MIVNERHTFSAASENRYTCKYDFNLYNWLAVDQKHFEIYWDNSRFQLMKFVFYLVNQSFWLPQISIVTTVLFNFCFFFLKKLCLVKYFSFSSQLSAAKIFMSLTFFPQNCFFWIGFLSMHESPPPAVLRTNNYFQCVSHSNLAHAKLR